MKKRKPTLCYSLSLLLFFIAFQVSAQQVFRATKTSVIGFLEYLPKDYNGNSDKYPVVIFLHGSGEKAPNTTDLTTLESSVWTVARNGPPKHVKSGFQFPFILISPQLKNNYMTWPSWYVLEVINYVKTYLRIDERRIYITGFSMGGGGTWVAAQDYPKLFAAAAPICGGYNTLSKACGIASENLPVWAFHGDADKVVPLSTSADMVNAINRCSPVPNPKALLTVYPGVEHNSWERAYTTNNTYHNPNLYQWMLSKTNTTNGSNRIPIANAGADITVNLPTSTATLRGSGTDSDGSITSYRWAKISGPSVTLGNISSSTLNLSALLQGTYMFKLTVTDNNGDTDSDYVKVTVQAGTNKPPVANAGPDITLTLPTNSVVINGSGTDSDGTIASYTWSKVSGSTATLNGASTSKLSVSNLVAGTYVFRLTVKDNAGATASDDVTVNVKTSTITTNKPPVANAGPDVTVTLPVNSAVVSGSGTDADGTVVSYAWTKISGGTVALSGANTARLSVSNLVEGRYIFRLTVKDDKGASAYDDMAINVQAGTSSATSANIAPTANAGPDITLTLPANSAVINGSGADRDGTIVSYAWTKISGSSASLSGANTARLSVSGLVQGRYVFRLTVKDDKGATGYDDMAITVQASTSSISSTVANVPPTADAGPDIRLALPKNSTSVYGSGKDADGAIVSYAWKKLSGGTATLSGVNSARLSVSGMAEGRYVFRLTVKDDKGATAYDDMAIIISSPLFARSSTTDAYATQYQDNRNGDEADEPVALTEEMPLDDFEKDWRNKSVIIYNSAGGRIYFGPWTSDMYHEVFQSRGLYIYNIIESGKRIGAGKILITQ